MIFLGIGEGARVFIIAWTVWPVVFISATHHLGTVGTDVVDAARMDGSHARILFSVRWPLAQRDTLATARATVGTAWVGVTAAEMIGASNGLGYQVLKYAQAFDYRTMGVYIFVIAVCGVTHAAILNTVYKRSPNYA